MNGPSGLFPSRNRFATRQKLVIMSACALVLLASMCAFLAYNLMSLKQESRTRLGGLGDIIAADISAALAFGDDDAVAKSLDALEADPAIRQVAVLDDLGQTRAAYHAVSWGGTQARPPALSLSPASSSPFDFRLRLARPILRDGSHLGTILLEQDPRVIVRQVTATVAISLIILLVALVLSYLLADRFQRVITGPVTAMIGTMEQVTRTKDFSIRVALGDTDEMNRLAGSFNSMLAEISDRDAALLERQERLHALANFDPLTRLPNRALFLDRLDQALHRVARTGEKVAVLFIDLDDFKIINDTHGHRTGDQVLQEAARRMAAITRDGDTLARLGGDEFTIFIQNIQSEENALKVGQKHVANLTRPMLLDGKRLFISASVGVAIHPDHGLTSEDLLKSADTAMYRAKKLGKQDTELFSPTLHAEARERISLTNDLRVAVENQEFVLFYQPKVDMVAKTWCGAEALLRWQHPRLGLLGPDKFIPLAEATGMILPIGEWVIREACRQIRAWQDQGLEVPPVAVNVSPLQLQRQDLVAILQDAMARHRIARGLLEVEVVESALINNLGQTSQLLSRIQALGIKVSIDDFGTGYSSLSLLRNLPINVLKIDRSFIIKAHESEQDRQILTAIVAMAQSLHLELVAEGIEHEAQEQLLVALGCQKAQGYRYSRPLPAEQLPVRLWGAIEAAHPV